MVVLLGKVIIYFIFSQCADTKTMIFYAYDVGPVFDEFAGLQNLQVMPLHINT